MGGRASAKPDQLLLLRVTDGRVALPAFVLQNDLLDRDCISIQVGQGYVFGWPAAVDLIARHHLSSLVQKFDLDVLSKILSRQRSCFRIHYRLGPLGPACELRVTSHPALPRDGLKLRAARRFSESARVTALSVFDHFRAPLQCTNL